MRTLAGYTQLELIHNGPHVLAFRAFSETLGKTVIVKILRSEYPTREEILSYEREFTILKEDFGNGVPRAIEMNQANQSPAMVLEDIGGRKLLDELATRNFGQIELLDLAIKIVSTVSRIHERGYIHCDLKPDNIIFNSTSGRLQIIDFGLAILARSVTLEDAKTLRGTFHYMSPEQTGRTQRPLDLRSDFYNLGVTFYKIFTGKLPFDANDTMGWVHCHLAQIETRMHEVNREIPLALSMIVQKLMKKSPDERYQSCMGLLYDLDLCRKQLQEGTALDIALGSHDTSAELKFSAKLYGRDNETKLLAQTFAKIVERGKYLVLIDGEAGTGKSSLVQPMQEKTRQAGGYFMSAKYDQFRKDIPFSALIFAFNQLVTQILTESDAQIQIWKEKILSAVGENAAVVTEVIPRIEMIIGKQAAVPALRGNEQRQRFQIAFHSFIHACCTRSRPLVIFLDDLQWADSASRSLIYTLLTEEDAESLLFLGAYRSGEVDAAHPLTGLIRDVEQKSIPIARIHLTDLSREDVELLIQETFKSPRIESAALAQLVHEKTKGNPFFVGQFLKDLFERKLLRFAGLNGWIWNLDEICGLGVTSNVLELLSRKIESLPVATQRALQLSACFGNQFRIEELKTYNKQTDEENLRDLESARALGLIELLKNGFHKFVHDRVQEAAYKLLPLASREEIHWKIANHLLASWSPEKVHDGVFYLVNHWNAGSGLVSTPIERKVSAELNLKAALRAKDSSVYDMASHYSAQGLKLLGDENWEVHGSLLRQLNLIHADAEYVLGRFDKSEKIFKMLLAHVQSPGEKLLIYRTMVDLAHMMGRFNEAIRLGTVGLATIGFRLPQNPGKLRLLFLMLRSKAIQLDRPSDRRGAIIVDEITRERVLLFTVISESAYFVNKNLFAYLLLANSNTDLSFQCFWTAILWQKLGKYEDAKAASEFLLKEIKDEKNSPMVGRGLFTLGGFTTHVVGRFEDGIRQLERGYHVLTQCGDLVFGGFALLYIGNLQLMTSRNLVATREGFDKLTKILRRNGDNLMLDSLLNLELVIKCLRGETHSTDSFSTDDLDEEKLVERLRGHHTINPWTWYCTQKMLALYIMGHYEKCLDLVENASQLGESSPFAPAALLNRVIIALVLLHNLGTFKGMSRIKARARAKGHLKFLRKLAGHSPLNFMAPYLIVKAEWHRSKEQNDLALQSVEKALDHARGGEILLYEALANETAANIYFGKGSPKVALLYLREALFIYENWGATAKVKRILESHPELTVSHASSDSHISRSLSEDSLNSQTNLDLSTVLKATNSLMSEINMTRLLEKLLGILIENAGAERGVLVLNEQRGLRVKGDIHIGKTTDFKLTDYAINEYSDIPASVISYVARTHEATVIENAMTSDLFQQDPYVQKRNIQSMFCVPIVSQGETKGLVYLENNTSTGVFTKDRVELVRVLSGQAAISLENARLYEQQGESIRMQNELVTAQAVQERLFPDSEKEFEGSSISGYYKPATECGGDWWYYSEIGDYIYIWIGDATGHGAPAALVTSAACSAVSVIEKMENVTPELALHTLNHAVFRTTKGKMNMTFFAGALNKCTGEFRYSRASQNPPLLMRQSKLNEPSNFIKFRGELVFLMEPNGPPLGTEESVEFASGSHQLEPGDQILFYTDGLPERTNVTGREWGERGFLSALHEAVAKYTLPVEITRHIVQKAEEFGAKSELTDDITICLLKFKGIEHKSVLKKSA